MSEFWAGVAQVIPVIALALVVEARAISASWTTETDKAYRAVLSILWTITLLILAIGEGVAIRGLQGIEVWQGWPSLITFFIDFAMGLIVVTAIIEFFIRGNAESIASLLAFHPIYRIQSVYFLHRISRTLRQSTSLIRQREDLIHKYLLQLAQTRDSFAEMRESLEERQASGETGQGVGQLLSELSEKEEDVKGRIEKMEEDKIQAEQDKAEHEVRVAQFEKDRAEAPERWRHASREERKKLAADLAQFSLQQQRVSQEQEAKGRSGPAEAGPGS